MKKTPLQGTIMLKMVESMSRQQDAAPRAINAKLAAAAEAVLTLEKLAANRNPIETDAAHAKRVADAAGRLKAKVSRLESEITEETQRQRERLAREIKTQARLTPSQHAAEIRASLRAMPEKERLSVMREALRGSLTGAEILAAVADGNFITTGLPDEVRTRFIQDFQKTQAPELFAEMSALEELLEHAPQVVGLANEAASEAVDDSYIQRINEAEKSAQAAADAFSASVI